MDALVELINDIKAARDAGQTDAGVTTAQDFQRRAQFYVDFIESENSNGFHASQEAARILGESDQLLTQRPDCDSWWCSVEFCAG